MPFSLTQRQTVTSIAAVRIDRVSISLRNHGFSGRRAPGAMIAFTHSFGHLQETGSAGSLPEAPANHNHGSRQGFSSGMPNSHPTVSTSRTPLTSLGSMKSTCSYILVTARNGSSQLMAVPTHSG